ncbi:MAG: ABC transporter permease [Azospirillaceae bacterium]
MARAGRQSYPLTWRLLDLAERAARLVWPRRWKRQVGYLMLTPAVLLIGLLAIGLGYMAEYSLHELDTSTYRLVEEYSLVNYQTIADRPVYLRVFWRTLLAAILVTVFALALAFPYAYLMVRTPSARTRKFLLIALFLPFFIGQVVRAYGWLIVLGSEGLINSALGTLGLPQLDLIYNYPAVIFGLTQYMLPFAVLMMVPAVAAIGEEVELASEGLGANWMQTFRHVVLPLARPGFIGAGIVVFTLSLTDFAMPEILGGGTSDFIASSIYDSFFQISNFGLGAAIAMVLVGIGSVLAAGMFILVGTGTLGMTGADKGAGR